MARSSPRVCRDKEVVASELFRLSAPSPPPPPPHTPLLTTCLSRHERNKATLFRPQYEHCVTVPGKVQDGTEVRMEVRMEVRVEVRVEVRMEVRVKMEVSTSKSD